MGADPAAAGAAPGPPGGGAGALCGACGERVAKYRCPGCGARTCSVACVRAHKEETGCSGERPPAHSRRVGRAEYGLADLRADYRFLEDARRAGEAAGPAAQPPPPPRREGLPPHLEKFRARCKRSGVELRLMQPAMQRRRENTSRVQGRSDRLAWRVEWRFHLPSPPRLPDAAAAAGGEVRPPPRVGGGPKEVRVDERVPENAPLGEVLGAHLRPVSTPAAAPAPARARRGGGGQGPPGAAGLGGTGEANARLLALRLDAFAERPIGSLGVFLREEGRPANSPRFHRLDLARSLRDNLAGKTVVEFPVFSVALPDGKGGWLGLRFPSPGPGPGPGPGGARAAEASRLAPSRGPLSCVGGRG